MQREYSCFISVWTGKSKIAQRHCASVSN